MEHQDFRHTEIGSAFEAIEGSVLPSLTRLIDTAATARPGIDADVRGAELRTLAEQLDALTATFAERHFGSRRGKAIASGQAAADSVNKAA